jgi:hypothetical protein
MGFLLYHCSLIKKNDECFKSLMNKKKIVRYISGYKDPDKDGIIVEDFKSVKIDIHYTKLYSSGMVKLSMLRGLPFPLFLFLCEISNKDGIVCSEEAFYKKFSRWMNIASKEPITYSSDTIRKGYSKLANAGLLIKIYEGVYRINPVHFWKGSKDHERVDAVKKLLEDKVIEPWYEVDKKKKLSGMVQKLSNIDFDDDFEEL